MDKKFEIIEGDDEPDPFDRLRKIGFGVLGFAKKSIKFGVIMVAETGNTIMYVSGQEKYAENLKKREPKDRMKRELKTAKQAFVELDGRPEFDDDRTDEEQEKINKLLQLGRFATMYVASALKNLAREDIEDAKLKAPEVADLITAIPDTQEGAELAEAVTTESYKPILEDINMSILSFNRGFPTQRDPVD